MVAFISFTLFCIISLSIQSSTLVLTLEGVISAITMPFQKAYDGAQSGVSRLWAGFTELTEVRDELKKTRSNLQKYESMAGEMSELKRENDRLRELLGMKERVEYASIPATIISKDPDNWFRTIIINKGSGDGIKVNMPVIAYQGGQKAVVGTVIEVRGSISRIAPIISPTVRIGVKLQESRFPGLLCGYSGNSNLCKMDYISRAAYIRFGDMVITSGQGGVFPPGLLVGTVIKSYSLESSAYQRAIIKPVIDYNLVEDVFVIKKDLDKDLFEIFDEDKEKEK
ncbi:MAG TPA: rod shape-determining protein MreC [Spirochaetota bacterium]|nr:rod shape-determining protein MreC [Spirochaetota bacterium]HPC40508.1 rod shape-determining protein MreC [Spirochaetota bacterium]HPL18012.1 rod shape-determining protein MreC [Spirochaetota bacterium]HQF07984.1 rod shape-determining protein MreC [Spirochaetota bacterium]HQH96544.1 rod shape-determining protein MreC [Spirochaetota bacterium]